MDERTDEELVKDIQEGSISAFETLVRRYEDRLLSFVYRILENEFDTQEVVQDTFFKVYTVIDQVNPKLKFSSYIFQIAKNASISSLRRRRPSVTLTENTAIETDEKIYENLARQDESQKIKKAIASLPVKYKKVIELYYFYDLAYEEISRKLKIPINTVRTHLARAKTALHKYLKHEKS